MAVANGRKGRGATVGTFDGVHVGHGLLLSALGDNCRRRGLEPMVVTFDRHPLATLCPERAPGLVMDPEERLRLLRRTGYEVVEKAFTKEYASLTAAEWLASLRDDYGVELVVVGYDNKFGSDGRSMSPADYVALGRSLGVEVVEAPQLEGVSSTAVRRLVGAGDMEGASRMLGRDFTLRGIVAHGQRLGRRLGFPTANLEPDYPAMLPARGVYAAVAQLDDGRRLPAVVNVGVRPSVDGDGRISVEAHIPGFSGDLYGRRLGLMFRRRLREERRFPSLDALRDAIEADVVQALAACGEGVHGLEVEKSNKAARAAVKI